MEVEGINKTAVKIIVGVLIVLAAFGLAFNTLRDMYIKSKLDAGVELSRALVNMEELPEYRYNLHSGFSVQGREEVISEVTGEKSHEKTHIKGEMVNTPVDIYYIDRTIYNYDSFSNKWLVLESDTTNTRDLLVSELNPLSNFKIKKPTGIEKQGFEDVDGTECMLVTCKTGVESELLETFWQDFEYQFWIDYHHGLIKKAALQAVNKESIQSILKIQAVFYDMNRKIEIMAPDVTEKKN